MQNDFKIPLIMLHFLSFIYSNSGYDEICCMGSEAINPKRNLPRAVMGTILLVTVLYVLAAFALVGMVPYEDISVTSGFPDGFRYRGKEYAAQISAVSTITMLRFHTLLNYTYIYICIYITYSISCFLTLCPYITNGQQQQRLEKSSHSPS